MKFKVQVGYKTLLLTSAQLEKVVTVMSKALIMDSEYAVGGSVQVVREVKADDLSFSPMFDEEVDALQVVYRLRQDERNNAA